MESCRVESGKIKNKVSNETVGPPNGGWGWLVVLGAFVVNIFMGGLSFTIGIFYLEIMERMDIGRTEVSLIGSFLVGFTWLSAILTGPVSHIVGYRLIVIIGGFLLTWSLVASAFVSSLPVLYITLGILPGIGLNMGYMGSLIAVNAYFEQKQSLAVGLAFCGVGVGTTIFAPMVQLLLDVYGFDGTMLIVAALCLHVTACGCLYVPLNKESKGQDLTNEYTKYEKILHVIRGSFDLSLFRNVYFVLFMLSNCLTHVGLYVPTAFLPEYTASIGINPEDASLLLSIFGISGVVGRLLTGPLSQRFPDRRLVFCITCIVICSASIMCIIFTKEYIMFALMMSTFGPFIGGMIILYAVLVVDLFGVDKLPTTLGLVTLSQGVGSIIGAPLAGALADALQFDEATFMFASIAFVLGAVSLIPLLTCNGKVDAYKSSVGELRLDIISTLHGNTDIRIFVTSFDTLAIDGAASA